MREYDVLFIFRQPFVTQGIGLRWCGIIWTNGGVKNRWQFRLSMCCTIGVLLMSFGCRDKPHFAWDIDSEAANEHAIVASGNVDRVDAAAAGLLDFRLIGYNVENWLSMERRVDGKVVENAPKPEDEKRALVAMIARHVPHVLGISEIGTPQDLEDLRERLMAAGVDLPYAHHHQGSDPTRALGLLSKYPITSVSTSAETGFRMAGRSFEMLRGILDATVSLPDGRDVRFLGVHLKSKREVAHYDQAQFRVQEAHRLRAHVDRILQADPQTRLVVFGDLNDTRRSHVVTTIAGVHGSALQLIPAPARDSRQHMWTHHWAYQDVYSRIDYIFISEALRDEADLQGARVIDDPEWSKASDHRPILLDFHSK